VTSPHFSGGQSLVPTIPASRRKVEKGTFINPNFVQLRVEGTQKFFAKASSDSASKFEFLALIETHQQSAKIFPARGGSRAKFVDHKTASKGLRIIRHADSEQDATSVTSPRN
jgi:hypothetical protein